MKFEVYCPFVKDFCVDGNAGKDSKLKCLCWIPEAKKCGYAPEIYKGVKNENRTND